MKNHFSRITSPKTPMTARRPMYSQSGYRNGSSVSFGMSESAEPSESYYRPVYVSPPKFGDDENPRLANGHGGIPQETQSRTYNFKIRTWIESAKPYTEPDCDEEEYLDIAKVIRIQKQQEDVERKLKDPNAEINDSGNGLSAADIRGAVGAVDGISGLSSSSDAAKAAAIAAKEAMEKKTEPKIKEIFESEAAGESASESKEDQHTQTPQGAEKPAESESETPVAPTESKPAEVSDVPAPTESTAAADAPDATDAPETATTAETAETKEDTSAAETEGLGAKETDADGDVKMD